MRLSVASTWCNPLSVANNSESIFHRKSIRLFCWQATTKDDAEMTTPTPEAKQRRRVNTNNKNHHSNNKNGCCCLSVNSLPSMWYGVVAVGLQVRFAYSISMLGSCVAFPTGQLSLDSYVRVRHSVASCIIYLMMAILLRMVPVGFEEKERLWLPNPMALRPPPWKARHSPSILNRIDCPTVAFQ